ncbi:MAG: RnfABCDGE type electron transport complex subunit B [Lentimicrobiaceae bacterium]|nr:RnfABCDGE type electron transport complex subunit B [Lentimicrobiaceae bacterium]
MEIILNSALIIAAIAVVAAIVLYVVSRKFKVYEDPKIDEVADLLPGANCGGCGFAGCRNFAENIVKNGGLRGKSCPPGRAAVNVAIAQLFGEEAGDMSAQKVVVRCNGSCENAEAKTHYDSAQSCAFFHMINAGESGCAFGCLGCGDCVKVCKFDAIAIDAVTQLPKISGNCVLCSACVAACPRKIIAVIPRPEQGTAVVACVNREKGADAKKNCAVACIACKKCEKMCEFGAISVENNLAAVNPDKCTACMKCVENCPTKAIHFV